MKEIVIHSVHHTILQRTHRYKEPIQGTHHYKELNVYNHSIYVYIYIYIYERDSPSQCTPYNPSKDTSLQGALQGTHQYKELCVCINYFKVYNFKEYYDTYYVGGRLPSRRTVFHGSVSLRGNVVICESRSHCCAALPTALRGAFEG